MYTFLLFASVLTYPNPPFKLPTNCQTQQNVDDLTTCSDTNQPAIAEKFVENHAPAVAEKTLEWMKRVPPEKLFPLFLPAAYKDLRDSFPIRIGMTKSQVSKIIRRSPVWPISRDKYYLTGGPVERLPEKPFVVGTRGRGDFTCLIFFKEGRVDSIWCQCASGQFIVGPPFVLRGDQKPRIVYTRTLRLQGIFGVLQDNRGGTSA